MHKIDPELASLLKTLTENQLRYVECRMHADTDAEAYRQAGINASTYYRWSNRADVDRAVILLRVDGVTIAAEKLRRLAGKAVETIADECNARRGSPKRLDAALAVLDRLGIVSQAKIKHEVSGGEGGPLEIVVKHVTIPVPGDTSTTQPADSDSQ